MGQKRALCRQNSVSGFFKIPPGTRVSPPVMLDTGNDDPDDLPTVQEEVPLN